MKRINSLKIITTILAFATFGMVLKSCKKVDNVGKVPTVKEQEAAKAAAIKSYNEQYAGLTGGTIIKIDKRADEILYKNTAGKMVSVYGNSVNSSGQLVPNAPNPNCANNCRNTTNPANLVINFTLNYAERYYTCESSSDPDPEKRRSTVFVKWTVSVPLVVSLVMAGNNVSNAYLRFTNSSGVLNTYFTYYNDPNFTITYVGPTAGCVANSDYEVKYKFTDIPNSYFASGVTISAEIDLASNCSVVGNHISSGNVAGPTFSQNGYLPCNRIDRVFISPGSPTSALAPYGSCSVPPTGFLVADELQIEYRQINVSTSDKWESQTSPVYWGIRFGTSNPYPTITAYSTTQYSYLPNMIVTTNSHWLVRYRNVKTGVCNVITDYPNSNIINPGGTPGANANWGNTALWFTEKY